MKELEPDWEALIQNCFKHPQDEARLSRFFQAILPYLRAVLIATYSRDLSMVDDAVQCAFLKYIKIFRSGRNSSLRVGYFLVVAKNCLIDEIRRRKGQIQIDEVAESELPSVPAVNDGQREARMLLLQHGMMQLDSRCQFILESYYINEVEAAKLASLLNLSPDSIYMALKRCRDRLRAVLAGFEASVPQASARSGESER